VVCSVETMTRVYTFLDSKLPSSEDDVAKMFRSGEFVFVPLLSNQENQVVQKGRFYSVEILCWNDPTKSFDLLSLKEKKRLGVPVTSLCSIYPSLHDFFARVCLVRQTPTFDDYLAILKKVAAEKPPSDTLNHVSSNL
jgi:hypothetical protein